RLVFAVEVLDLGASLCRPAPRLILLAGLVQRRGPLAGHGLPLVHAERHPSVRGALAIQLEVALHVVVVARVDVVGFALLRLEKLLLRRELVFRALHVVAQPHGRLALALVGLELLLVAGLALANGLEVGLHLADRFGVLLQRAGAGVVDVPFAGVGRQQRAVAARRLPRRVVFRALLRVGCFLDQAILLACRRVEALDYRALRAELLHRLPEAFGGNGGAVVALAI